jgi:hypothetical protein
MRPVAGPVRPWARLTQSTLQGGWVFTCDRCKIRETYIRFWTANTTLRQHVAMHEDTDEAVITTEETRP